MEEKNFETTIVLNEEKVNSSPYSKEGIYAYLENVFQAVGMEREEETFKRGTLAEVLGAMSALYKIEWFMKLVKEWTLSIREDGVLTYTENVFESKLLRKKYLNKYGL